ncbi:hypothetical protein [Sphingobium cloacae]|nr:hypothetical protein [Sphingobium cloacae]
MLHALLDAAGSNVIEPVAEMPDPSPADAFGDLMAGARSFELAPGVLLADHLWDHAGDYRRGALAERLRATAEQRGKHLPGFLAVYATSIRTPLAYGPHRMPLRVAEDIAVPAGIGGPYLVLVSCRLLPNHRAEAVCGFAQPILSGRGFVPVFSDLERDIFEGLIGLQVALDAHGLDCTITRVLPPASSMAEHDIHVAIGRGDVVVRELRLAVRADCAASDDAADSHGSVYVIKSDNWVSGDFLRWLEQAILGKKMADFPLG